MSAFVVKMQTIHRAVGAMVDFSECPSSEKLDRLGQDLWDLNVQSVNTRYPEGDREPEQEYKFIYLSAQCSNRVQALKSLQCLMYQCSEGNIPETSLLYRAIQKTELRLMHEIIDALPEYKAAKWE